jgi:hypothetical protein
VIKLLLPSILAPVYQSYTTYLDSINMPGTIQTPQSSDATPAILGVYLLTHPRSASNLFQTMMSKQPGFQNSGYKLFDAGFATLGQLHKGPLSEWPEEERKALYAAFQTGFERLQDELADAKKNVSQREMFIVRRGGEVMLVVGRNSEI